MHYTSLEISQSLIERGVFFSAEGLAGDSGGAGGAFPPRTQPEEVHAGAAGPRGPAEAGGVGPPGAGSGAQQQVRCPATFAICSLYVWMQQLVKMLITSLDQSDYSTQHHEDHSFFNKGLFYKVFQDFQDLK